MTPQHARERLIACAKTLGFHRVGVARADAPRRYDAYLAWIESGMHGEMAYLATPSLIEARRDSEALARGARSIVSVALAYDHVEHEPPDGEPRGRVARYARGLDYHPVVKARLTALAAALADELGGAFAARAVTDTAPLLERALAERAGLGFIGKNTMLISPGLGSFTVLGELLTDLDIATTEPAEIASRCGECRACLDACPTQAFAAPFILDARRCISYLTIEHRGSIAPELRRAIGDRVFGCDICQDVCPYNSMAPARASAEPAFASTQESAWPRLADLLRLRSSSWKRLTRDRSLRRATRQGLVRNAIVALGNVGGASAIAELTPLLASDSPSLVEHAAWALGEIALRSSARQSGGAQIRCRDYQPTDWPALCELHDLARILELAKSGLVAAFRGLAVTAKSEGLFDGGVRVAIINDAVAGFVAFKPGELTWLYVHPREARRGVGRALMGEALSRTGRPVIVELLAENEPAIALYRRGGFRVIEERHGTLLGAESFPARGLRMFLDEGDSY